MEKTINSKKKLIILLVSLILVLTAVAGTTVAFVITKTSDVKNIFQPSYVACEVLEGEDGKTFDGMTKKDVRIKNTGDTEAYIRAAVVVTWVSESDKSISAQQPEVNEDYSITYTSNSGWIRGSDGYWYYTDPVASGDVTGMLFDSCEVIEGKAPEGYYLSVEIVASAIQSVPETVVEEQWGVTVTDDVIVLEG